VAIKFSNEVSAGHIMTALSLAASVFAAYSSLDKRIAVNTTAISANSTMHSQEIQQIRAGQNRIEGKLDRVIERGQ